MLALGPLAAEGLVEAARVAVVPCAVVALVVLVAATVVPVRAKRPLVALAAVVGVFGFVAYGFYLLNSA